VVDDGTKLGTPGGRTYCALLTQRMAMRGLARHERGGVISRAQGSRDAPGTVNAAVAHLEKTHEVIEYIA
jgi:hypothetical protein